METNDNAKGVALFIGAVIIIPLMDALAKYLSHAVSPGEITFARMFLQALLALPFVLIGLRLPSKAQLKFHCLRGCLIASSAMCFSRHSNLCRLWMRWRYFSLARLL